MSDYTHRCLCSTTSGAYPSKLLSQRTSNKSNRKCRYTLLAGVWMLVISAYCAVYITKDDVITGQMSGIIRRVADMNLKSGLFMGNINNTFLNKLDGQAIPMCPTVLSSDIIDVKVPVNSSRLRLTTMAQIELDNPEVRVGGTWSPGDCTRHKSVAIVIPYRNRPTHLKSLLAHLHPFLRTQKLNYTIYVVEQVNNETFNRGMLMNVGAVEASRMTYDPLSVEPSAEAMTSINSTSSAPVLASVQALPNSAQAPQNVVQARRHQCIIFHDVDLLPEDLRIMYTCPEQVRHMSIALNKWNYKVKYKDVFGGVTAMSIDAFRRINGFSNRFWGWGGEDDNLLHRVQRKRLSISKYPVSFARYTMLDHKREKGNMPNPKRYDLIRQSRNTKIDETDGLHDLRYKLISRELRPMYTNIRVSLTPEQPQQTTVRASTAP